MRHPHLDAFHAPAGYVPVRSHLDGVEVYAPAGPVAERPDRGWGVAREARICAACGLEFAVQVRSRVLSCPACGSGRLAERVVGSVGPRPHAVVPFSIDAESARANARSWLIDRWTRPPVIAAAADGLVAVWVPVWVVHGTSIAATPAAHELGPAVPDDVRTPYAPELLEGRLAIVPMLDAADARLAARSDGSAELVLVPIWAGTFVFAGSTWTVRVDGRTGEVRGRRPVAWSRVRAHGLLLMAPGLFLGTCVGLPTLVIAGFGLLVWMVALLLLAAGGASALRVHSRALEDEGR